MDKVDNFVKDPKKALFTLAYPMLIAMFVQSMYNIVDTAFVGRLGAESIAALTFSFPLFFVLISLNAGIGTGMNSRISRFIGAKNKTAAENTAMHGIMISLLLALAVFFSGELFLEEIFLFLGATESVTVLAVDYMSIVLIGTFFMFPSFMINSIFSAQGDTKTPMKVQVTALLLNMILDPVFIYVLGYGVKGAAIATVIAFFFSLIMFTYYLLKKSELKIEMCCFHPSLWIIAQILKVGAPASMTMLVMSIYAGFLNRFMAHFGTDVVAAFGIAFRLESVAIMPIVSLSLSTLTITGMFYGAEKYQQLEEMIWYALRIGVIFTSAMAIMIFALPQILLRIFTDDISLIAISTAYLRISVFTFPLIAVIVIIERAIQGMGYGMPSFVINLTRVFLTSIPLAYLFIFVLDYGYVSVAVAMVLGGVIAAIIALLWLKHILRKIDLKIERQKTGMQTDAVKNTQS